MPGMPYHLEKGPWLSILEDYLNADTYRMIEALRHFRNSHAESSSLASTPFLLTPALDGDPDYPTLADRRRHLQNDWFGSTSGARPSFVADTIGAADLAEAVASELAAGADMSTSGGVRDFATRVMDDERVTLDAWPSTGFWFQYHGDVEGIVRESLIRGIEVALGIDHDADLPTDLPPRILPIELFWKCPQRWFEGWVTWRWDDEHCTGQVTVMFATPGSGKPVLESPGLGDGAVEASTSRVDVDESRPAGPGPGEPGRNARQSTKGMWVISQAEHVQLPATPDDRASGQGDWVIPPFGPSYVGVGEVICVQPAESDGGVKPFGRRWEEPNTNMMEEV